MAAEKLSTALSLDSAGSLADNTFEHELQTVCSRVESISFILDHKVAHAGLNPAYLLVKAEEWSKDGESVVFTIEEVAGERREMLNRQRDAQTAGFH
ncbi:hypothetical protein VTH82DRAFT_6765 [Thermothelomyces myriococcoides]